MELDYKAIGRRIKDARLSAGLTQEKLSEKVSLSISHMSNIETGTTKASLNAIVNIANALSVSANDLLYDNLVCSRPQFEAEMQKIIDGCTPYELRIMRGVCKSLLDTLRNNKQYFDNP